MEELFTAVRIYLTVIFLVYLLGCSRNSVEGAPTRAVRKSDPEIDYLTKYGYLKPRGSGSGKLMSQEDLAQSLRRLQSFAGLNETGILDAATIKLMGKARCGMPDVSSADKARRRRRYVLQGTSWKKKRLTYRIDRFTHDLSNADQKRIFKWAFDLWSKESKMKVTEAPRSLSSDKVDISIRFVSGAHGDSYPFDGRGGTLAHAFYPHDNTGIAGDAHFDDAESFTTGERKGVNLDWVALHEFGHSLGLDHSRVRESVMYPWYKGFFEDIKLTSDDINGIRALYGVPERRKEPTDTPFTRRKRPKKPAIDECEVKRFDAWVYSAAEKKTYAFIDDYYFIVDPDTVGVTRGPLKIVDKWKEVQTPIDAAYTRSDGRIVFFRGGTYWKYYGGVREQGPRPIRNYGLPKELEKMDGAYVWGRNSRTYFWKGDQYWRYNDKDRKIDPGYPKSVTPIWKKIPANIDTIMNWSDGKTYFFKGTKVYKLDDYTLQSDHNYPKSVMLEWLKCDQSKLKVETTTPQPTVNATFVNTTKTSVNATQEGYSGGQNALPSFLVVFSVLIAARLL